MRWKPRQHKKTGDWHRWFAWFPVFLNDDTLVWWEWIERRHWHSYDEWEFR